MKRHTENHESSDPGGKKRKRQGSLTRSRVSQACKQCTLSKLRCSEKRPCDRCEQKKIACVPNGPSTASNGSPAGSRARDDSSIIEFAGQEPMSQSHAHEDFIGTVDLTQKSHSNAAPYVHQGTDAYQHTEQSGPSFETNTGNTILEDQHSFIPESDHVFPSFLRELLLPGDGSQPLDIYDHGNGCNGFMPYFDLGMNHDFDDWNLGAVEPPDARSVYGLSESAKSAHEQQLSAQSPEEVAIVAGAKAFKNSIWHWIPASEDTSVANQSDLNRPAEGDDKQQEKVRLPPQHQIDQATRDKVLGVLLMACDPSTMPKLLSSFPSRAFLERNLWMFLQTQLHQWNAWIHLPTLEPRKLHPLFVGAAFAAGATCVPNEDIQKFGYALQEVLRGAIGSAVCNPNGQSALQSTVSYDLQWEKDNSLTRDLVILQSSGKWYFFGSTFHFT